MHGSGYRVARQAALLLTALAALAGCATLAVNPCDTIEDRDGKYFGRFFLGVATLGLSEVTIQQEEVRQAYQGAPGCPPQRGSGSWPRPNRHPPAPHPPPWPPWSTGPAGRSAST